MLFVSLVLLSRRSYSSWFSRFVVWRSCDRYFLLIVMGRSTSSLSLSVFYICISENVQENEDFMQVGFDVHRQDMLLIRATIALRRRWEWVGMAFSRSILSSCSSLFGSEFPLSLPRLIQ